MEILNIGPLELILILLVMFFLLGPKGMLLTAQKIGRWIREFVRSPMWKEIMGYSQEIRELPQKIMDDTGLKEALEEVEQTTKATATELNTTVNEAVQAARVTEAEHVRIDTNPTSGPSMTAGGSETKPRQTYPTPFPVENNTIAPAGLLTPPAAEEENTPAAAGDAPAVADRAEQVLAADEPSASGEEGAPAVAGDAPAVAGRAAVADTAGAEAVGADTAVAPKRGRGRPRKVVAVQETSLAEPAGLEAPMPEAATAQMAEVETAVEPAAAAEAMPGPADTSPEVVPARKRGRPRKIAAEPAPIEIEPVAVFAVETDTTESAPAAEGTTLPGLEEPASPVTAENPPARRRGRPRKAAEVSTTVVVVDAVPVEPAPAAESVSEPARDLPTAEDQAETPPARRRGRPRKISPEALPAPEPPTAEVPVQENDSLGQPTEAEQPAGPEAVSEAPMDVPAEPGQAAKPRRLRAPRSNGAAANDEAPVGDPSVAPDQPVDEKKNGIAAEPDNGTPKPRAGRKPRTAKAAPRNGPATEAPVTDAVKENHLSIQEQQSDDAAS